MLRDSNRHLEIKIEALEEENAMLQRMLFGKKSEKSIRGKIEIEEEEAPPVVPPQTLPSSDTAGKTPSVNKKRRLNATVTKQIEQLVVPKEVMENPFAYERLPESCDKISRRLEYIPGHFELHIFRMPGWGEGKDGNESFPLFVEDTKKRRQFTLRWLLCKCYDGAAKKRRQFSLSSIFISIYCPKKSA